jgi:hypothetical protein
MVSIATIKYVNDSGRLYNADVEDYTVPYKSPAFLSELPPVSDYNPLRKALEKSTDPEIVTALRQFATMPASTAVFANPVCYRHTVTCGDDPVELSIRSFGIRGCLLEEDIVTNSVDAVRVIFVGLFGRFARTDEYRRFARLLWHLFEQGMGKLLPTIANFVKAFPTATADIAIQHVATIRKIKEHVGGVNASRPAADLLRDLLQVHIENIVTAGCASYMRALLRHRPRLSAGMMVRKTQELLGSIPAKDPFRSTLSLLLTHSASSTESRILEGFGTIQIHHGSAGSNMVARYLASLHTRSVSDLFIAGQMALDCARHFGAIHEMTEFVSQLEGNSSQHRDQQIRQRVLKGNLPAFGHPEIAAASRTEQMEIDPRPAIYLSPLFEAIDTGSLGISDHRRRRIEIVQRIYQIAFVEGIVKPGRRGRLRVAPNTDFGAWIIQEALGIDERDRTLLSYVFRGFGWMMDVREQLQQPIIRPVIPPDPAIVPPPVGEGRISQILGAVHERLCKSNAFAKAD